MNVFEVCFWLVPLDENWFTIGSMQKERKRRNEIIGFRGYEICVYETKTPSRIV
jgi:hypothetical protein